MRALLLTLTLALAGCAGHDHAHGDGGHADHVNAWQSVDHAVAVIHPTEGNTCAGVVRFSQTPNGVRVTAEISGLTPGAKHGFHIHELGDATSPDGKSMGGHYNPGGHDHAGPDKPMRHAGDLGNLQADDAGNATYDRTLANISVADLENPIVGRGVVIHAGEDDLSSQPTGAAGARIGRGVIGVTQP